MTVRTAIELPCPDISKYRSGNTGIDYLHRFETGVPGPHVMISGLVHGNEICGAIAVDRLMQDNVRPVRGVLSFCLVNVEAYSRFDPNEPRASRFVDEDLNRVWSPAALDGLRQSQELSRSRELRAYVDTVDYLLDIHSMDGSSRPLVLSGPLTKGKVLAERLGIPETVVADAGHKAGTRLRDYGGFGDPTSPKTALLVECGSHWQRGTDLVAIDTAYRFLSVLEMVARTPEPLVLHPAKQRVVRVTDVITIGSDNFRFTDSWTGLDVVPKAGTTIAYDGEMEVKTPYDRCVLVMPSANPRKGITGVRLGAIESEGS